MPHNSTKIQVVTKNHSETSATFQKLQLNARNAAILAMGHG
jgi:hypothetical protein